MGDEEFTEEELKQAIALFKGVKIFLMLVGFAFIAIAAYGGYTSWPAFIVIPMFAIFWFCLRVLRRLCDKVIASARSELEVPVSETENIANGAHFNEADKIPSGVTRKVTNYEIKAAMFRQRFGFSPELYVVGVFLSIGALWYSAGIAIRLVVGLF